MLIALGEGLGWVDIPSADQEGTRLLSEVFGFHPIAVRDGVERNYLLQVPRLPRPRIHRAAHARARRRRARPHHRTGPVRRPRRFLVTVHGPAEPGIDPQITLRETRAVLRRIEAPGACSPPRRLSCRTRSSRHDRPPGELLWGPWPRRPAARAAGDAGGDPRSRGISGGAVSGPGTSWSRSAPMATLSREDLRPDGDPGRFVPGDSQLQLTDIIDQFERVAGVADAQKQFLQGVIDFYRAKTETKMTIAAEGAWPSSPWSPCRSPPCHRSMG